MNSKKILMSGLLMFLMPFLANAEAFKCIDAMGKVTYANTPCQAGVSAERVKETASVIDASVARELVVKQAEEEKLAQERLQAAAMEDVGSIVPGAGGLNPADMAKLSQAQALGKTAISAREQLGIATFILVAVAAILMIIFRSRKKK